MLAYIVRIWKGQFFKTGDIIIYIKVSTVPFKLAIKASKVNRYVSSTNLKNVTCKIAEKKNLNAICTATDNLFAYVIKKINIPINE